VGTFVQGRLSVWPTTFYLDASLTPNICRAIDFLRDDVVHPWQNDCPIDPSDKDDVWLPIVGGSNWVVIMRDNKIRGRLREKSALIDNNVRAFNLKHAGNYKRWDTMKLLVTKWDEITAKAESEPGPYIYSVTQSGIKLWLR
jgi:hypothetical protein